MTNTGMKAPQGTGMVVASADIQNCRQHGCGTQASGKQALLTFRQSPQLARIPRGEEERKDSRTTWLGFKFSHLTNCFGSGIF